MGGVSNRQVVEQLKAGNNAGCRHLVRLYQDRLISEAVKVFRVPFEDAEELVSDVILAVVTNIHSFQFKKSDADFHYWVMTIFRNRVRDFVRHCSLTEGLFERFDESLFESEHAYSAGEREVIGAIVRGYQDSLREPEDAEGRPAAEKLRVIADTLDSMETWERVLLRCRAVDVPYEEIARYTGKTSKQLKVYHARVRRKFAKLLAEKYPELAAQ